ncbi:MAG: PilN domain-containing protein [Candidatus Pacebacteria bacterium]|nr:PilN domain-containing protein [Candidatus Paceibacterota bacterium]
MPETKVATIDINLVPKDPFFETLLGRSLKWALSAGRYIVMFTELIVVLSFVTRFYLDRQITDLNRSLFQKESVIRSYGDFEDEVRGIQERLSQYDQIEQEDNIADTFPLLAEVIPSGIKLDELVIYPDRVALKGTVLSQKSLNILINNLQISPDFSNVVVSTIESEGLSNSGFLFQLTAQTQDTTKATPKTPTQVPAKTNN